MTLLELVILALQIGNPPFPIEWSVIGAVLFVGILKLQTGSARP